MLVEEFETVSKRGRIYRLEHWVVGRNDHYYLGNRPVHPAEFSGVKGTHFIIPSRGLSKACVVVRTSAV